MTYAEQLEARISNQRRAIQDLESALESKDATIASLRADYAGRVALIETLKLAIIDVLNSTYINIAMAVEIGHAEMQHLAHVIGEEWPR